MPIHERVKTCPEAVLNSESNLAGPALISAYRSVLASKAPLSPSAQPSAPSRAPQDLPDVFRRRALLQSSTLSQPSYCFSIISPLGHVLT